MSSEKLNSDALIGELGGCGRFQVIISCLSLLPYMATTFTMMIMVFGAYNPGWRCLDVDNITSWSDNNTTGLRMSNLSMDKNQTDNYFTDTCEVFEACQQVEFNPEASTIATEWGLICHREWIVSTVIAIQMGGNLCGSFLMGFLGDRYGRKSVIYISLIINSILNVIAMFSASWEMYATITFFLGITNAISSTLGLVYLTEFVTVKWRIIVNSLPVWCIGCIIFSGCAYFIRDWKYLYLTNAILSFVCCLPGLFLPESLRWLLTQGKESQFYKASAKIAKINKIKYDKNTSQLSSVVMDENTSDDSKEALTLLFSHRKYRTYILVISFQMLCSSLIYFSTSFGISSLPGDFYVNNFILFVAELPANFLAFFIPNIFGRKRSSVVSYAVQTLFLFGIVALDFLTYGTVKDISMLVFVIMARVCIGLEWYIIDTYNKELFPTVMRSTAVGIGALMSDLGSVVAPFLIPSAPQYLYISYVVMGGLSVVCGLSFLCLPETKDIDLEDNVDKGSNGVN